MPVLRPLYISATMLTLMVLGLAAAPARAGEKSLIVGELSNPESSVVGEDGKIYVTAQGRGNVDGDGQVMVIENGKASVYAKGMDDPKGIDRRGKELFVADRLKVWRIDEKGAATVFVDTDAFPTRPRMLNDLAVAPNGDIFVSETFGGVVYRITPSKEITPVIAAGSSPAVRPNGLLADGPDNLLVLDFSGGKLFRLKLADKSLTELATGLGQPDGVARDAKGRLYTSDYRGGKILRFEPSGGAPTVVLEGLRSPADLVVDASGRLLIPEGPAGTLSALPLAD